MPPIISGLTVFGFVQIFVGHEIGFGDVTRARVSQGHSYSALNEEINIYLWNSIKIILLEIAVHERIFPNYDW